MTNTYIPTDLTAIPYWVAVEVTADGRKLPRQAKNPQRLFARANAPVETGDTFERANRWVASGQYPAVGLILPPPHLDPSANRGELVVLDIDHWANIPPDIQQLLWQIGGWYERSLSFDKKGSFHIWARGLWHGGSSYLNVGGKKAIEVWTSSDDRYIAITGKPLNPQIAPPAEVPNCQAALDKLVAALKPHIVSSLGKKGSAVSATSSEFGLPDRAEVAAEIVKAGLPIELHRRQSRVDIGKTKADPTPPTEDASAELIATQCPMIKRGRENQAAVSEAVWYGEMGLTNWCKDGAQVAQNWSIGHPGHTPIATEVKRKQWVDSVGGPPTCDYFDGITGCKATCPYAGKISSPLQLGQVTERVQETVDLSVYGLEVPTALPKLGGFVGKLVEEIDQHCESGSIPDLTSVIVIPAMCTIVGRVARLEQGFSDLMGSALFVAIGAGQSLGKTERMKRLQGIFRYVLKQGLLELDNNFRQQMAYMTHPEYLAAGNKSPSALLNFMIGSGRPESGAIIQHELLSSPTAHFQIDEAGGLIGAIAAAKSTSVSPLDSKLRDLVKEGFSWNPWNASQRANRSVEAMKDGRQDVWCPSIGITLIMPTSDLLEAMTPTMIKGGGSSRFLWYIHEGYKPPIQKTTKAYSMTVTTGIKNILGRVLTFDHNTSMGLSQDWEIPPKPQQQPTQTTPTTSKSAGRPKNQPKVEKKRYEVQPRDVKRAEQFITKVKLSVAAETFYDDIRQRVRKLENAAIDGLLPSEYEHFGRTAEKAIRLATGLVAMEALATGRVQPQTVQIDEATMRTAFDYVLYLDATVAAKMSGEGAGPYHDVVQSIRRVMKYKKFEQRRVRQVAMTKPSFMNLQHPADKERQYIEQITALGHEGALAVKTEGENGPYKTPKYEVITTHKIWGN